MNRNLIYLAIVIILGGIVYFILNRDNSGSYSEKDKNFAIGDTAVIGRILMSDLNGDTADLKLTDKKWTINNKYDARVDAVHNLLVALNQIEVNIPVSKSMHNTAVKDIATKRTKVEIFDTRGNKLKGYYLGDPNNQYGGNYALMEGSKVPFIVDIPGFDGFLSARYFVDQTEWRDRTIFKFDPAHIQELSVAYSVQPDSSFSIVKKGKDDYELNTSKNIHGNFNNEIADFYLRQFKFIACENFIMDAYKRDSLLSHPPVCDIKVTDDNGNAKEVKIYYRPVTYRTKEQYTNNDEALTYDVDKFYGIYNNNSDLVIIQNFVFGKLFVGPQYFYRTRPVNENTVLKSMNH